MNSINTSVSPERNRIFSLDAVRGFALLGIVLVNSLGFNASFFNFGGFYLSIKDPWQLNFYSIFINLSADKFIFLFSFLFGYGIQRQYKSWKYDEWGFSGFFSRRMLFLFTLGALHIMLLWAGDILLLYSIAGIIVLSLRKLPNGLLLGIGFIFYFFIVFYLSAAVSLPIPNPLSSTCPNCLEEAKVVYSQGSYFEVFSLRLHEYFSFRNINLFYYLPKIIGLSLIGFAASTENLHQSIATRKFLWTIIWVFAIGVSIFLYFNFEKVGNINSKYSMPIFMAVYEIMNFFISTVYFLSIFLLASSSFGKKNSFAIKQSRENDPYHVFNAVARARFYFSRMGFRSLRFSRTIQSATIGILFICLPTCYCSFLV